MCVLFVRRRPCFYETDAEQPKTKMEGNNNSNTKPLAEDEAEAGDADDVDDDGDEERIYSRIFPSGGWAPLYPSSPSLPWFSRKPIRAGLQRKASLRLESTRVSAP